MKQNSASMRRKHFQHGNLAMESAGRDAAAPGSWARKRDAGCHEGLLAAASAAISLLRLPASSFLGFSLSPLRSSRTSYCDIGENSTDRQCEPQHLLDRAWDSGSIDSELLAIWGSALSDG